MQNKIEKQEEYINKVKAINNGKKFEIYDINYGMPTK